ncbi:hypothetical protein NA57DRAFT_74257 [Rhizodiscina lignyota]|uniref:Uncharacterized protein n=1 Tax=Rhizodiscina lignyota TaxID=1504668 RepID=A0A9P4IJA1_9PEZI|nr:hypothetical protein NA57DRAFT_74257 [Rhizodiscina lignyota]
MGVKIPECLRYSVDQGLHQIPAQFPSTVLPFENMLVAAKSRDKTKKKVGLEHYVVYEAQFSFAICGSDNSRWIAYAFDDTDVDDEDFEDSVKPIQGFLSDPIAWNEFSDIFDANFPIWNPREYFLTILNSRTAQALKEWEELIGTVQDIIKQEIQAKRYSSHLSGHLGTTDDPAENAKENFDWILQAMDFLNHLIGALSKTNKATQRFINRDISYFTEMDCSSQEISNGRLSGIPLLLDAINETFDSLEDLQRDLIRLHEDCDNFYQAVNMQLQHHLSIEGRRLDLEQVRLGLQGYEAAQHNGVATEFTIAIIAPFALTTATFSIPQTIMPFKMNVGSFLIAIVIITAATNLVFRALSAMRRKDQWWKTVVAYVNIVTFSKCVYHFLTKGIRAVLRSAHDHPQDSDVEQRQVRADPPVSGAGDLAYPGVGVMPRATSSSETLALPV